VRFSRRWLSSGKEKLERREKKLRVEDLPEAATSADEAGRQKA
jgi:hypothetical protein